MRLQKGQNSNRPPPGSRIKVEPIRTKKAIEIIKSSLHHKPRDLCLFTLGILTLGIYTAYQANEILSITVGQVRNLQVGHALDLKQSKTQKYRMVTLNRPAVESIRHYLRHDRHLWTAEDEAYLFYRGVLDDSYSPEPLSDEKATQRLLGLYADDSV